MKRRCEEVVRLAEADLLHVGCVGEYTWIDKLDHDIWIHGAIVDKLGHDSVVGIDYYKPGVEAVREAGYDVRYENAETFDLDREFDQVLAPQMLHHLSNPGMAIQRFKGHLRPGGEIILAHPNHYFIERQLKYGLEARNGVDRINRGEKPDDHSAHTAAHRPDNLLELFEREGCELVEGYYVPSGSTPSSLAGLVWHRGVLPAADALLPDLFTKKTYVAVFEQGTNGEEVGGASE